MTETTSNPVGNVIAIDDERIKSNPAPRAAGR